MTTNLSSKLTQAANTAEKLEHKLNRVTLCARWLLESLNASESVHDSELIRYTKQLTAALDAK